MGPAPESTDRAPSSTPGDPAARPRPAALPDPAPRPDPAPQSDPTAGGPGVLRLLTGPDAGDLLAQAVATAGGHLVRWRATQVDHRPGASTTVAYTARIRWADVERDETLGASAGFPTDGDRPGVLVLSDGATEVAIWRVPFDPGLPALAVAADPAAARPVLAEVGLVSPNADDDGAAALDLRIRSYRPRRRAVIEARAGGARTFLKVVRPDRVADLHRRHRVLVDAGVPVPVPLGWRDEGLLVLQALGGHGLRAVLRRQGARAVDPADLLRVLDALPAALLDSPRKTSWTDGAAHYARVIGAALPQEARRAAELADAVVGGVAGSDEPEVVVHGDFYEAQVFVRGGRVSGVLDVDSAGPGRRADDLGCLLAHVEVLTQIWPAEAAVLRGAVEAWYPVFARDSRTSPRALRLRTAGVLLSLATGPHRVQQEGWEVATSARLDLVERWLT